jgi:hypothetical protein
MPTKLIHRRSADPMRECDLLLLENVMMRCNYDPGVGAIVEPTRTAIAMRVASLLLIALGVLCIGLHDWARKEEPVGTISSAEIVVP